MVDMLFVVSTAGAWTLKDGTKHPTGYCGEELAIPHHSFSEAGWEISIATPGAMAPTLDDLSVGILAGTPSNRRRIRDYLALIQDNLDRPIALDQTAADDYGLVFYPGGHGPMEDLAVDPVSGALLTGRLASGKPLALLCHAPAARLAATSEVGPGHSPATA